MRSINALLIRLLPIALIIAIAVFDELKRQANAKDSSVSGVTANPPRDGATRKVINYLKLPEYYEWEESKSELGKSGLRGEDIDGWLSQTRTPSGVGGLSENPEQLLQLALKIANTV